MRVPLSWLREYVDIQLTPEQLAERLTLLGMEVKGIEQWGSDWQNVMVGELLSVEKHPRADRMVGLARGLGDVVHAHARYDFEIDTSRLDIAGGVGRLSAFIDSTPSGSSAEVA